MRQRKLNRHYELLKLELRLREECDWLLALRNEITRRLSEVRSEAGSVMEDRIALERTLCPVEICKPKEEPNKRGRKPKVKTEEELLKELKGFTIDQIEQIERMLESKKKNGGA